MADSSSSTPPPPAEDIDLYGLLGIEKTASQADIKKAYRKLALTHHPDKVPEAQRAESEIKFKAITQAYEILRDEQKRDMYDQHGMAAFDPSRGGAEMDINDLFSQMFGGMGMRGGPGGGRQRPRRGADEEQPYRVTLEELYKGKTVKFSAKKKVVCEVCKGSGAKKDVKKATCEECKGAGVKIGLRRVGPGLVTQQEVQCDHCGGSGVYYKEKDRCKKCKGKRVTEETKALEMYIPPGSAQGQRIILEGEADQFPDQQPGDIVFVLIEEPHEQFTRIGNDLSADLNVTLAEALTGFSRVVLKHLDARGLLLDHPQGKILRPGEVLKVTGEGMPILKSEMKGDMYLIAKIEFPEDGWLPDEASYDGLKKLLPPPEPPITADEVDEVDYENDADIEEMGARSGDPRSGAEWEDEEEGGQPQCTTQ